MYVYMYVCIYTHATDTQTHTDKRRHTDTDGRDREGRAVRREQAVQLVTEGQHGVAGEPEEQHHQVPDVGHHRQPRSQPTAHEHHGCTQHQRHPEWHLCILRACPPAQHACMHVNVCVVCVCVCVCEWVSECVSE